MLLCGIAPAVRAFQGLLRELSPGNIFLIVLLFEGDESDNRTDKKNNLQKSTNTLEMDDIAVTASHCELTSSHFCRSASHSCVLLFVYATIAEKNCAFSFFSSDCDVHEQQNTRATSRTTKVSRSDCYFSHP